MDFKPPLNFYRLLLNEPNEKYTQIDITTTTGLSAISKNNFKYLFDDNKILNCKVDESTTDKYYFYDKDNNENKDPTQAECITDCTSDPIKRILYPGVSSETGMCDYNCGSDLKCVEEQFDTRENYDYDYDYQNNDYTQNFCDYPRLYNLFYKCV